ncbi:MAG: hypothetical protein J7J36_01050, partial [Thermoplasmata archaeon]|nr:hypothetical protein [Thermoplasmata archaeon]
GHRGSSVSPGVRAYRGLILISVVLPPCLPNGFQSYLSLILIMLQLAKEAKEIDFNPTLV